MKIGSPAGKSSHRATPKKKPPPAIKHPDHAKALIRMRRWVEKALHEVKEAQKYMGRDWKGPHHECLEWAQSALESAMADKNHPKG